MDSTLTTNERQGRLNSTSVLNQQNAGSAREHTIQGTQKLDPLRLSSTLNQRLTTLPMGKQETDTIKRINNDFDAQTIALDKLE